VYVYVHTYLYIYTHILKISHLPGGSLHDGNTRFCIHRLLYTHTHHTHTQSTHKHHTACQKELWSTFKKNPFFWDLTRAMHANKTQYTLPCFCKNIDWRPDQKFLQGQKASFANFLCKPMKYMFIPVRVRTFSKIILNHKVWHGSFVYTWQD